MYEILLIQGLKFKADLHSKINVCRHELGVEPLPIPPGRIRFAVAIYCVLGLPSVCRIQLDECCMLSACESDRSELSVVSFFCSISCHLSLAEKRETPSMRGLRAMVCDGWISLCEKTNAIASRLTVRYHDLEQAHHFKHGSVYRWEARTSQRTDCATRYLANCSL